MIPVLLALGLIAGFIPVLKWWFALIAGAGWAVVIAFDQNDLGFPLLAGAFALGALNGLVGWGAGRVLLRGTLFVLRRTKHATSNA